jgi:hypothetical protein
LLLAVLAGARADGPADNHPEKVRRIPPTGIAVGEEEYKDLKAGVIELHEHIRDLRERLKDRPALLELLPDVEIFHKAVHYALHHDEFTERSQVTWARELLKQGRERAEALRRGKTPWTTATGLVVRGYRSRIDDSVQPYGLVVPPSYQENTPYQYRLDLWCHGRGETLTEVAFLHERQTSPGQFTPRNAFVLHPYGRYCNAFRFAGEVDTFEALEHVKKHYPIDENRIAMRGFSMGGAACWQFAVHHPGTWAAAAPGAGFAEAAEFLKVFQSEKLRPTWYEKKLWHLYDSTDYALNVYNCPLIAYSGEKDRQKQAADVMAAAMEKEGLTLLHLIGPKTEHSYEPRIRAELDRRFDRLMSRGRDDAPPHILFTTWTLRYHRMRWLILDELEEHWRRTTVEATMGGDKEEFSLATRNVAALTLHLEPGEYSLSNMEGPNVVIDDDEIKGPPVLSDRSWTAHFRKKDKHWELVEKDENEPLRKRHGLQGPIDDAFMESFLMVRPTGKPFNEKVGAWAAEEMRHARDQWRQQFRGDARFKDDTKVNDADIAEHNLVLWGDPSSNKVLARIADRLPIRWSDEEVKVGKQTFAGAHHAPVLIYPNPLNSKRYVVLNSGFTYREYDYLNNARQSPKLPDYAVIDVRSPPSTRLPGAVAAAGFFDEGWKLSPRRPQDEPAGEERQIRKKQGTGTRSASRAANK